MGSNEVEAVLRLIDEADPENKSDRDKVDAAVGALSDDDRETFASVASMRSLAYEDQAEGHREVAEFFELARRAMELTGADTVGELLKFVAEADSLDEETRAAVEAFLETAQEIESLPGSEPEERT